MNNNLIIALSGASHSGKTAFMEKMKEKYPHDVVLLDEEIRDLDIGNIDEIRKDPIKYFELELKIIKAKMEAEANINENYKEKVILVDRSLVDSYFYYTFYIDKSNLPEEYQIKYHNFMNELYSIMKDHMKDLYDIVYFFKPITELTRKDDYTQKNLMYTQLNEYRHMLMLTLGVVATLDEFNEGDHEVSSKEKIGYYNAMTDYKDMEYNIKEFLKAKIDEY